MNICKFCDDGGALIKNGFVRGKQRYLCKVCDKNQVEGDLRIRHSERIKLIALRMYVNNGGIRSIANALQVSPPIVLQWIRKAGLQIRDLVQNNPVKGERISIMEMDEMYSYIQKNSEKYAYGLVSIETGSVCLISKSEVERGAMPPVSTGQSL